MEYSLIEEGKFKYIETGTADQEKLVLLHGLFGTLSNFDGILNHFGTKFNVVIPILPIFDLPLRKVSVSGLVKFLQEFIEYKGFSEYHVLGNSLGGHISLLHALNNLEKIKSITLTGSSGLFENSLGSSFPPRSNYEFVERKTRETFYDPEMASREQIDEIYE